MLTNRLTVTLALCACLATAGCARPTATATSATALTNVLATQSDPPTSPPSTTTASPDEQDTDAVGVNWDAPLPGGLMVAQGTDAAAAGQLTFKPLAPRFAEPIGIQVSDPSNTAPGDRAVAYLYRFPDGGTDFPYDGRVRVLEYHSQVTEAQLEEVAANPPGPPENFKVIQVAGHSALLVQANGIGRVQYVQDGVMIDVFGPAIPVAEVEELAANV
ncbi:hypothetical protein [Nakamurella endophytica]|uniref:Uncharacterized protein n=1 Tax=Nakamurella endophytica TaxID=1748367 RepID=A0A917TBF5_9ACTN|nr:hypothetical protein [Nakamurella endophytica]GGM16144.1 hypothetical protein GCM10011594_40210 [Nakamurella endophytica]